MKIRDIINKLIEDNNICYYSDDDIDTNDIMNRPIKFIREYLKVGDKLSDLFSCERWVDNKSYRLHHTVSIYTLGIIIYQNVGLVSKEVDNYFRKYRKEDATLVNNDFYYYWFLICFFHDMGYLAKNEENKSIYQFGECDTGIKNKTFEVLESVRLIYEKNNRNVIPNMIYRNFINYDIFFNERRKSTDINDEIINHGYLSAAYYYKQRQDSFNRVKRTYKHDDDFYERASGEYVNRKTNIVYKKSFLKTVHAEVSSIILAHNIFFCNANGSDVENINTYRKHKLDELIINEPIYNLKKYPLLFLLSLVDTIDIYKYFKNNKVTDNLTNEILTKIIGKDNKNGKYFNIFKNVIDNVELDFGENSLEIKFEVEDSEKYVKDYSDRIKEQKYWLAIDVIHEKGKVKIVID